MKKESPLVSIIVPVYNVDKYLSKCLTSLINQSYRNIEIIVVNDGSTDSSLSIIQYFCTLDKRILCVNKENGGLASARNAGVKIASGVYVWHVDSDDYVEDCLNKMVEKIIENNTDILVTGYYCEDENNQIIGIKTARYNKIISGEKALELMLTGVIGGELWTKLYKRKLYTAYNIIQNEDYSEAEDVMANFQLFYVAKSVCFSDIISVHHIRRIGSYSDASQSIRFREKHYQGITSLQKIKVSTNIQIALKEFIAYDFLSILKLRDKDILKRLDLFGVKEIYNKLIQIRNCHTNGFFKQIFIRICHYPIFAFIFSCVIYLLFCFRKNI